MSIEKPSSAEDEYFLREEAARKKREAIEKLSRMDPIVKRQIQALHHMKCPRCGFDLQEMTLHEVTVDKCYQCFGMWLDQGEWETLAGQDKPNIFQKIASIFQSERKEK